MSQAPVLSAILVAPGSGTNLRCLLAHLRRQTVREQLEIVLVLPDAARLSLGAAELEGFASVQVLGLGPLRSYAAARAAGVQAARAPVVALMEDHAFPAPDWAAALLAAHAGRWAAVGPAMHNANPASLTSWTNLLVEYTPWLAPAAAGPVEHLPGHNSSYKRTVLLEYGDRLAALLEAESVLHWDLRARGHQLYLEPAARTYHLNFSAAWSWPRLRFQGGRLFAGCRARRWPRWRRALYALGAPLIPPLRLWRIARRLRASGDPDHLLPRILPLLALALAVDAVGEGVGYAGGPGEAAACVSALETDRTRYLRPAERRLLEARPA